MESLVVKKDVINVLNLENAYNVKMVFIKIQTKMEIKYVLVVVVNSVIAKDAVIVFAKDVLINIHIVRLKNNVKKVVLSNKIQQLFALMDVIYVVILENVKNAGMVIMMTMKIRKIMKINNV